MSRRICNVDGCSRPQSGNGFCNMHYKRFKKHGSTVLASRLFMVLLPASFGGMLLKPGTHNPPRQEIFRGAKCWRSAFRAAPGLSK